MLAGTGVRAQAFRMHASLSRGAKMSSPPSSSTWYGDTLPALPSLAVFWYSSWTTVPSSHSSGPTQHSTRVPIYRTCRSRARVQVQEREQVQVYVQALPRRNNMGSKPI